MTDTELTIHVPGWCRIGHYVEIEKYNKYTDKFEWQKKRIIGYTENSFLYEEMHDGYTTICETSYTCYGRTVRSLPKIKI